MIKNKLDRNGLRPNNRLQYLLPTLSAGWWYRKTLALLLAQWLAIRWLGQMMNRSLKHTYTHTVNNVKVAGLNQAGVLAYLVALLSALENRLYPAADGL